MLCSRHGVPNNVPVARSGRVLPRDRGGRSEAPWLLKIEPTSVPTPAQWLSYSEAPLGLRAGILKSPCIADIDEMDGCALVR